MDKCNEDEVDITATSKRAAAWLERTIKELEDELSVDILIGDPWLLVCRDPKDKFDLVYGKGYNGENIPCFRYQRGIHLEGAVTMTKLRAKATIAALAERGTEVRMVHENDYAKNMMNEMKRVLALLRGNVAKREEGGW